MTERLAEEKSRIGTWGDLNPSRLELILKYAGQKILDAGCANGAYVRFLLKQGYDAFGLDLLPSMDWEGDFRERFKSGDINQIPYKDGSFDTVTAFEVLEHVKDIDKVLKELIRVTRENIILSVPDSELYPKFRESGLTFHHWVDRTHVQFFTEATLKEKLVDHRLFIHYFGKINPIYPEILLLDSLRLPHSFKRFLKKAARKLPLFRREHMTLVAVVDKKSL